MNDGKIINFGNRSQPEAEPTYTYKVSFFDRENEMGEVISRKPETVTGGLVLTQSHIVFVRTNDNIVVRALPIDDVSDIELVMDTAQVANTH
jgi:hypothetical protein